MTIKEYKEKRDSIGGFDYWDYYGRDSEKAMRAYNRECVKGNLWMGSHPHCFPLPDSNYRARYFVADNGGAILESYYTTVCKIEPNAETGELEFFPMWNGYSATTMKHINRFRALFGLPALSKREWIEIC